MSSVVCCEGGSRRVSVLLLLLLLCLQLILSCNAGRINRSAFMDGDVRSEVVDPNNRTIWSMFNLTQEQVRRIQNGSNPSGKDETTQATRNQLLDQIAVRRMNEVQQRIQFALSNKQNADEPPSVDDQPKATHEKAGYPMCNGETTLQHNWQRLNNVTLQFADSIFQHNNNATNVESAFLRLYKVNPRATAGQEATRQPTSAMEPICPEPMLESQIRVTVSIVYQLKKKQTKKRTCNTMMLSSTKTGWVDIDVKCALNYWCQPARAQTNNNNNSNAHIVVGQLMIEVHDDEENQLLPGLYFRPPTCDQADLAVPWTFYRSATSVSSLENNNLSKCPRLDVLFVGNGDLSVKNFDHSNYERSQLEALKHKTYNPNRSKENLNTESTTLNSPTIDNMLENSENESQEMEQVHHHRRHHHHNQQQHSMPDCESNYHHRHHHQHHNHHKHHNSQSEE
ncbi:protein anachronism isoform X2 [Drosophila innubila]|uniref:protein anachronism isoform X2 n=1 Tax=Drosophila innubila TaxID=198719 RepID=UPI00148B74F3|nr:protein anachronism isoform X2 [Drosophila innubila]